MTDRAHFLSLADCFDGAWSAGAGVELWVSLAGRRVHIRGLGTEFTETVCRAVAGLPSIDPGPANLSIDLRGTEPSGDGSPPDLGPRPASYRTWKLSGDQSLVWEYDQWSTQVLDRASRRIIAVRHPPHPLNIADASKPLGRLLAWWLHDRGLVLAHAGAVSIGGEGILLAGRSGAGKSTAALAAAVSGLDYVHDDVVALETLDSSVIAHSLFSTGLTAKENLQRFPFLASLRSCATIHPDEPKALLRMDEASGVTLAPSTRIRALVMPEVTPGPCSAAEPTSAAPILIAMSDSNLFIMPTTRLSLSTLASVARMVPSRTLHSGSDLSQIGPLLGGLV